MGKGSAGSFGSKGKVSERRNFGVEWLLGAVNGEEPQRRIHTWCLCLKLALNPDPYKSKGQLSILNFGGELNS
jgi:hypothetical protein